MIVFRMTMPNYAVGLYHKIVKWEMTPDSTHALINSYATESMGIIARQDTYTIPLEYKISTIDDIEFILTAPGAPMAGGTIVPDVVETLQSAQARKWAMVKVERDKRVNGTFETSFGPVQIDNRSVIALATAKRILTAEESTVVWTMADNAAASLTSPDIDTMLDEVDQTRRTLTRPLRPCAPSSMPTRHLSRAWGPSTSTPTHGPLRRWPLSRQKRSNRKFPENAIEQHRSVDNFLPTSNCYHHC